MPNIKTVLDQEIRRLARKEVKSQLREVTSAASSRRREVAELKKQVRSLQRQVDRLEKRGPAKAASAHTNTDAGEDGDDKQTRFSPAWLKKHREKLELSAADYAKLVGASALSIYKWEKGETNPRRAQREALAEVRGMGKREAVRRLEEIDGQPAAE